MEDVQKLQNKQKSQRPLSELLQEQQEPFIPMDFLRQRHLRKKFHSDHHKKMGTKINKKAQDCHSPTRKPNRLPGQSFKVGDSDPLMNSLGLKLPLPDTTSMRSHGRPQYKVSSPLRSPLKSPVKSSSCIKSPSRGAARLMEAAVRILEPGLHTCSRPRPSFSFSPSSAHVPNTVRYLLDQDHKINEVTERRKRLRESSRKAQFDLSPCADQDDLLMERETSNSRIPQRREIETSCSDRENSHNRACSQHLGSSSSSSRESAVVGDSTNFEANQVNENVSVDKSWLLSAESTLNAWQRASEAFISAFRLSPAKDPTGSTHKKEGSLVHYSRIFSFNKGKKANQNEGHNKTCSGQNNAKYSLLKSILRRLTPAKEAPNKVNCNSERFESDVQSGNSIDNISKRFSNAMGSFSRGSHRPEMQRNDQVRLRIRDIVRWNSFEESDFHNKCVGHSGNGFLRERATSLEHQSKVFGDVMVARCLSMKTENVAKKSNVILNKKQVDNWQVFLDTRKNVSSEFSFTSCSSAWLESSLDSDSVSTSVDVLSSTGSSEGSGISESGELKGNICISEDECPRGYFSFDIEQNDKAKDFDHCQQNEMNKSSTGTQLYDITCYESEGSAVSKETIQKDCIHCSKSAANSTMHSVGVRSAYDTMRSPARLHSSCSTEVEEENEEISPMDDNISDGTGDDCSQNDNCEVSETGCFEEAEQLSPVSVLDSPFEDTPGFENTYATIQRAKRQLLKKISAYEQLAYMDPLLLEKRVASWKDSSEDESGNCTEEDESQSMGIDVDSTDISSSAQTSPCTSHDDEMDWEEDVGTEYHMKQDVHFSQTIPESLPPASPLTSLRGSHHPSLVAARQAHKLLFDRVNEELQSSRKRHGCGFMAGVEPWLREQQQQAQEQLVKKIICGQISPSSAWKEEIDTDSHADRIVELDFKRERQEWKIFREEAEEVGVNIELAIFGVLVEEVLLDLVQL